ncbi:PAS domain-containing protein [Herbidospora cretacea]|uniref:PAS domain-containing protein n=1 Tax=Herbidospora cretacea TaxID=28444 RepID=UPI0004C3E2F3|nr:PAS domain-containing protein [Herbidospora cretacea]
MSDSAADAFDSEFIEFQKRLAYLRESRAYVTAEIGRDEWIEAALLELDVATEELKVRQEELLSWADQVAAEKSPAELERLLLRAAFAGSPFPSLIVTGDDGVIRRANAAALALLDVTQSYAAGRPFPVFADLRFRAALRSALAAASRTGEARTVRMRLVRRRLPPVDVTLAVARLDLPGERPHLLIGTSTVPQPEPVPSSGPEIRPAREDVLSSWARLLLSPGFSLGQAAGALREALADWVYVDLVDETGAWRPAAAVAGEGLPAEGDRPLALQRRVLETGRMALDSPLGDLGVFGEDADGVRAAARLNVGSLVCVPLTARRAMGTVTVARRGGGRRPLCLAEAGLLRELGDQLALRLDLDELLA